MPDIITAITVQKKNKDRLNVFVNHQYAFSIHRQHLLDFKQGDAITHADIDRLKTVDEADTAYFRALYFLKFRPRSRYEIQKYLKDKKFLPETVTDTIRKLEAAGYLNDFDFARLWVESRLRCKPRGMAALREELRIKGISEEMIQTVLTDLDEKQAAWDAVLPKLRHWDKLEKEEFKKKVYGHLTRRGFHYSLCSEIFEQAWEYIRNGGQDAPEGHKLF